MKKIMFKTIAIFFTFLLITTFIDTALSFASNNSSSSNFSDDEFESFSSYSQQKIDDPLEKYNRKIFIFNDFFDRYFFEYVAKTYSTSIPKKARLSIRNFLTNLTLPVSAVNSFLEGSGSNGLATISNFIINSTLGIGGLFDVASEKGIYYKHKKFSDTLGHYGVESGTYLVIPFLGPSSTRDFTGFMVDRAIDPMGFNFLEIGGKTDFIETGYRYSYSGLYAVDTREKLLDIIDDIRKDSFDPYATIRSAYLQKRQAEIQN